MSGEQCFFKLNSTVTKSSYKPCGIANSSTPILTCCEDGDTCLSNGLCHYTRSVIGGSGYYAAGCTDQKYSSKVCPQLCNDQGNADVVYSGERNSKRWACCGMKNGAKSCEAPTKEMFDAPQANQLQTLFTIGAPPPKSTSHTSSSTAPPSSTSRTTGNPKDVVITDPPGHSAAASTLSPSAYGGIGAGAAAIALLALVGGVLLCRRKRRRREREALASAPPPFASPYIPHSAPASEAGLREYEEKETLHEMPLSQGAPSSHETSPVELSSVAGSMRGPGAYRANTAEAVQSSKLRHELPADNEVRPATAVPLGQGPEIPASLRAPTRPVTQGG